MARQHARDVARDLLQFIACSPTAAHAVAAAAARLDAAGFRRLDERDAWQLAAGDACYTVRNHHALVAFRVGRGDPAQVGFRLAGAHTDAPGLHLKPNAAYLNQGYLQLGVEVYGGPLLASWVDRDLTLAGKLFVREPKGPPRPVLVHGDRPLCRIPLLAIHFQRDVNEQGLKFDKQKHLPPIVGVGGARDLKFERLLRLLADGAGVDLKRVVACDLEVVDTQPPALGGLDDSLIFAPRIDNLAGSHAALTALIEQRRPGAASSVIALFDSEEVGSQTVAGAGSFLVDGVLERLTALAGGGREAYLRALARSFQVSVDAAHAVHPNHAEFHDANHRVELNRGPVLKINAQQRYATSPETAHWFEHCCQRAKVPVQRYIHRTDLTAGTTIGPISATRLGVPTVDVGSAILSMHSIRETGGAFDQELMIKALGQHLAS
ncbi:MAG: M18 family aminopeptidase [Deltaproteobacteria bacterium]|nr:M18 family aminopeptidase [Deltaproteobacteria bacterium]